MLDARASHSFIIEGKVKLLGLKIANSGASRKAVILPAKPIVDVAKSIPVQLVE